jgi:hypothetical protein
MGTIPTTTGQDRIPRDLAAAAQRAGFTLRHVPALIVCTGVIDRRPIGIGFTTCQAARRWLARRPSGSEVRP